MQRTSGSDRSDGVILDVRGLTKVFGLRPATARVVDGVDFTVRRGDVALPGSRSQGGCSECGGKGSSPVPSGTGAQATVLRLFNAILWLVVAAGRG